MSWNLQNTSSVAHSWCVLILGHTRDHWNEKCNKNTNWVVWTHVRTWSAAGPRIWNSLPPDCDRRTSDSVLVAPCTSFSYYYYYYYVSLSIIDQVAAPNNKKTSVDKCLSLINISKVVAPYSAPRLYLWYTLDCLHRSRNWTRLIMLIGSFVHFLFKFFCFFPVD